MSRLLKIAVCFILETMFKSFFISLSALGFMMTLAIVPVSAELRIGIAVPLTGIYASLGKQIVDGAIFATEEINISGGLLGETLKIEAIDDKCDPKTATGIANQLVGKDVFAVIGHLCDRPSIEGATVYAENKIVQISPTSQNPAFTENRPIKTGGTYRLAARNTQQADILADFIAARAANDKIAVVNDGSVYGKGLADALLKNLKGSTVEVVLSDDFESGEERYRTLSARIVDSGANFVFVGGNHRDVATLIKDLDRLSDALTIISGDGVVHADFPNLVLEENTNRTELKGLYSSFPPDPRLSPAAQDLLIRFRDFEVNPAGLVLRGYSAVTILRDAVEKAQATGFDRLNDTLNSQQFDTALGTIKFDVKGDSNIIGYAIHEWKKDTLVPIN